MKKNQHSDKPSPQTKPAVTLDKLMTLKVVAITDDGDPMGEPEEWSGDGRPPRILIVERKSRIGKKNCALGFGDRVLARIEQKQSGRYRAHPLKQLEKKPDNILGVVRVDKTQTLLEPTNKRLRMDFMILPGDLAEALHGELVLATPTGKNQKLGMQMVKVIERLGSPLAPRSMSLIAIHQHGLPTRFPDEALAEAKMSAHQPLGEREDLRDVPLITIDPADARDHDDAIWAESDGNGGWNLIVAIADVSYYVRPGTSLDAEARARGNSAYFPDRVVPMLPEILSADVCSLMPELDRACLAAHIHIDAEGKMLSYKFTRALMRSAANLAYEMAQEQHEHVPYLKNLWGAWSALTKARHARAPLDLDLPERRVELDEQGVIRRIAARPHLDAHRVVEDFMIMANVAAAKQLEKLKNPVVYRIHEPPTREKLLALKDFLESLDQAFALGQLLKPAMFNSILEKTKNTDVAALVQQIVLRTQTQAYYGTAHLGHFGLALPSYGHFTSPIRRYSDLMIHRALVSGLKLGDGGMSDADVVTLDKTCEHISSTERRAMIAERDTIDRYVAAYLSARTGEIFPGRITGVTKFGLFVTLDEIGGDGLVPIGSLGQDYFTFHEKSLTLKGDTTGTVYHMGQQLALKLIEAKPVSGGLQFEVVVGEGTQETAKVRPKRSIKHRGKRQRHT